MCPLHQLGYLSLCPSKFTSYGLFRIYWWITPHLLRCLLWYLTIFNTFHQAGTSFRFHLHGWSNLEFTRHLPWYTQWSVLGQFLSVWRDSNSRYSWLEARYHNQLGDTRIKIVVGTGFEPVILRMKISRPGPARRTDRLKPNNLHSTIPYNSTRSVFTSHSLIIDLWLPTVTSFGCKEWCRDARNSELFHQAPFFNVPYSLLLFRMFPSLLACGRCQIRTDGALWTLGGFQDRWNKPLSQSSLNNSAVLLPLPCYHSQTNAFCRLMVSRFLTPIWFHPSKELMQPFVCCGLPLLYDTIVKQIVGF